MVEILFERGTLVVPAVPSMQDFDGVVFDDRSRTLRAAAYRWMAIRQEAASRGIAIESPLLWAWPERPRDARALELRGYQRSALKAWHLCDRRGLVVLPTGAGKTRVAVAAIFEVGVATAVLCPTRALATLWRDELARWFDEPIGVYSDGERSLGRITVFTFESAYRHMDTVGDRFGLIVVDEVHHFGSGARVEALESSVAPFRLGLTATAPPNETAEALRLQELIGDVAFELCMEDLVGTHLAPLEHVRISVRLDPNERAAYERAIEPLRQLQRTFFRNAPSADYTEFLRAASKTSAGRAAIRLNQRAQAIASFPTAKQRRVHQLLEEHRGDKTIVFTAQVENAYAIAQENLILVIAGETRAAERDEILDFFRRGRLKSVVAARVLNEGIDVPDASVAIVVAGTLGLREHVQRIGRVLRPSPGKRARVYELITTGTTDERKASRRAQVYGRAAGGRGDVA